MSISRLLLICIFPDDPAEAKTVGTMLADDSFRKVLDFFDLSWSGYRKVRKGVKKRLHRHMQQLGCRRMSEYLTVLKKDRQCRRECEQLLTVSISRFFRDRPMWETLERDLLPQMAVHYPLRLTVWSAGCASGEEAYSFKIIWARLKRKSKCLPNLYLVATDTNRETLARARSGVYRAGSLREVPADWIVDHFSLLKRKKTYRIHTRLQREIIWMQHDLLWDPPSAVFNIIFLRNNLLTYYRQSVQQAVLSRILKQLTRPGLLIVGSRESCPPAADTLIRHTDATGVYLKG